MTMVMFIFSEPGVQGHELGDDSVAGNWELDLLESTLLNSEYS